MAHTLKPWTSKYKAIDVYAKTDIAELAARLGSIVTYDRRGDVIFLDSFEDGIVKWEQSGTGTGNEATISTDRALTGGKSCALTAGEGSGGRSTIYKFIAAKTTQAIGIGVSFNINEDTTTFDIKGVYQRPEGSWYSDIIIDVENDRIRYRDGIGLPHTLIDDITLESRANTFNTAKLVLDTEKKEYLRFMINNESEDMSGIELMSAAGTDARTFLAQFDHKSDHDDNKTMYVDNVIVTLNEP
jgi:hypothetical protein